MGGFANEKEKQISTNGVGRMDSRQKYSGRDVVCPYYVYERDIEINCIGCQGCSTVRLIFSDKKQKLEHMKTFCNGFDYMGCPYAQAVEMDDEKKQGW